MAEDPKLTLAWNGGRLQATVADRNEPVSVRIMYAQPLTARREIVLLDGDSKEVATLHGLEELDERSQEVARAALADRYHLPQITRVVRAVFQYGTRYFEVETDHGSVTFALREPGKNVSWLTQDRLVLRDTMGGPFEVPSLAALDSRSRRLLTAML